MDTISIFWFRRDLRLEDNTGLLNALRSPYPVLCLFIFDKAILDLLEDKKDARVEFIYNSIVELQHQLINYNSTLLVRVGKPEAIFYQLLNEYKIDAVYSNEDYEPYALVRDKLINDLLVLNGVRFKLFKDQVIFAKDEITSDSKKPYSKFSPYAKKWRSELRPQLYKTNKEIVGDHFFRTSIHEIPSLKSIGFEKTGAQFRVIELKSGLFKNYQSLRNIPAIKGTSRLGPHLRFGTISIRNLLASAFDSSDSFVNELIWREFFMQLLWHYPFVIKSCFRKEYNNIQWINNEEEFLSWCEGRTGFPIVDAGMRELNETGFMHNRVRMITAGFLVKHLLIDWRWGEAYFAQKLLDYELASNNGNWQWVAGCGADYAPYFRIFNPITQAQKFDPNEEYIKKWIPEINTPLYPEPIIHHKYARERCLKVYKESINQNVSGWEL